MSTCPNCNGSGTLPRDPYAEYQVATNPVLSALMHAWLRRHPEDADDTCTVCGGDGNLDQSEAAAHSQGVRRGRLQFVALLACLLVLLALAAWWTAGQFAIYG